MSKDLYIKISTHFGIESVENLVAIRRNRFINRYGETDNYLNTRNKNTPRQMNQSAQHLT